MDDVFVRVRVEDLDRFVVQVLGELGVPAEDARVTAEVLTAADLRGVDSHGVANLGRTVRGLRAGALNPRPQYRVLLDSPTMFQMDAGGGLGHPAGRHAMQQAIARAGIGGLGVSLVCNSSHYGIAGYYAMLALERDMIGISMTNAHLLVTPTFGREALLGTNPLAMAAPAGQAQPFVLDMATSVVAQGKVAIQGRLGQPIPPGWALDEDGRPTTDTQRVLANLSHQLGGGLLPLGGEGEITGGHKGYGLALMVDILCGVLSGAGSVEHLTVQRGAAREGWGGIGHFFLALNVAAFRPLQQFRQEMDALFLALTTSAKAPGYDRIYIPGAKEFEMELQRRREGIPLHRQVLQQLGELAASLGLTLPATV